MYIKNANGYQEIFDTVLQKVIKEITEWLLEGLQTRIKEDVYTTPNTWYVADTGMPTLQFYHGWGWSRLEKHLGEYVTKLFLDKSGMDFDEDDWVHGSPISGSAIENIEDILNLAWMGYRDGYTSSLPAYGDYSRNIRRLSHFRKPYWNNFIDEYFESGKVDKQIETKLRGMFGSAKIIATGRKAVV